MIKAWFRIDKKNHSFRFEMKGHAGDADVAVCNAATTLAYTLAQNFNEMDEHGMMSDRISDSPVLDIRMESGNAHISAVVRKKAFDRARIVFRAVMEGYYLLMANYPQEFRITKEDIDAEASNSAR